MTAKIRRAAIVLCGGKSTRMGVDKATLPFGEETMLQRIVRILRPVARDVCVIAQKGQVVPELPDGVITCSDESPDLGPLEGIRVGLEHIATFASAAFVTSCDVPFLKPRFVNWMFQQIESANDTIKLHADEIVVPDVDGYKHPLSAVYSTKVLPTVQKLLAEDRRRPAFLFDSHQTRFINGDELKAIDPQLDSLKNLNQLSDYVDALHREGFKVPTSILEDGNQKHGHE